MSTRLLNPPADAMTRRFRLLIYANDACVLSGCLACLTAGFIGLAATARWAGVW